MGGEFTYQPKWTPIGFDNHSHIEMTQKKGAECSLGAKQIGMVASKRQSNEEIAWGRPEPGIFHSDLQIKMEPLNLPVPPQLPEKWVVAPKYGANSCLLLCRLRGQVSYVERKLCESGRKASNNRFLGGQLNKTGGMKATSPVSTPAIQSPKGPGSRGSPFGAATRMDHSWAVFRSPANRK